MRAEWLADSRSRSSALPMTMLEADRFSRMRAPASAARVEGGRGAPVVLADLDGEGEAGPVLDLEHQTGRQERPVAADPHRAVDARAGGEPALLIIFAIVGQEGLGHDGLNPPAREHQGAVVQGVAVTDRGASDRDHPGHLRGGGQGGDTALDLGQQGVLHQQVVDGVAGQAEFGEDDQVHALRARLLDQGDMLQHVGGRVGGVHDGRRGSDAHEALVAGSVERFDPGQGAVLKGLLLI